MRRLEDVATEIHHDVRRRIRPRGGRLGETGKEIGRKLQTRWFHDWLACLGAWANDDRAWPLAETSTAWTRPGSSPRLLIGA